MPLDTYTYPHDISKRTIKLEGLEITDIVTQTDLYFEILSPFWTGSCSLVDSTNLHSTLPIQVGQEIEITIGTQATYPCQETKTFTFYIYKVGNKEFIKDNVYKYSLFFITEEYFINQKIRISKSIKNLSPCQAVSKIIKDGGLGDVEHKDGDPLTYSFIVPNWAPIIGVEWISKFTKVPGYGPDFLFFQMDDKKFKYESIEEMFKDKSEITLKQVLTQERIKDKLGSVNEESYLNIEQYNFIKNLDATDYFSTGTLGNTVLQHDLINKKFNKISYTYSEDNTEDYEKRPFSSNLMNNATSSVIKMRPIHSKNTDGYNPNESQNSWIGKRKAELMKLEMNKLLVDVPGHVCFYKFLGKSIEIFLPLNSFMEDKDVQDKYYKGDYLLTAIHLAFNNRMIKMYLELNKKRLETAI